MQKETETKAPPPTAGEPLAAAGEPTSTAEAVESDAAPNEST